MSRGSSNSNSDDCGWFHPKCIKYVPLAAINYIRNVKIYLTDANDQPLMLLNSSHFIIVLHFVKL